MVTHPPWGWDRSAFRADRVMEPTIRAMEAAERSVRVVALVRGRVQGVGFRFWTRSRALELGLRGWARNLADGRVEVVAEGARLRCADLLAALRGADAPGRVDAVDERYEIARGDLDGFVTG
jgi:acylphosphatase